MRLRSFLMGCRDRWNRLVDGACRLGQAFWIARMPALILVLGALLLTVPPQTADLLAQSSVSWDRGLWFLGSVFAWGFTLWYAGRWAINLDSARPVDPARPTDADDRRAAMLVPRLLATLPVAATAAALWNARESLEFWNAIALAALLAVVGVVLVVLAWGRRRLTGGLSDPPGLRSAASRLLLKDATALAGIEANKAPADASIWCRVAFDLQLSPFGQWFALALILLPLLVLAAWIPWQWVIRLPEMMGVPAAFLAWLALLTTPLTFIGLQLQRRLRLPQLAGLLLIAAATGQCTSNHGVRRIEDAGVPARMHFDDWADRWLTNCGRTQDGQAIVAVLVATAGGASRAAVNTVAHLERIDQAMQGRLAQHLFAYSGVSGGGLGAAIHLAGLAERPQQGRCQGGTEPEVARLRRGQRAFAAATRDLMAALMAAYAGPDLVMRYLPFVPSSWFPDRAVFMEWSLERAWACHGSSVRPDGAACTWSRGDATGFAQPFAALYARAGNSTLPLLFLNGTSRDSGRKVLTAPVRFLQEDDHGPEAVVPEARDAIHILGRDVRLSTAVTNAARFPFVSPIGVLVGPADGGTQDAPLEHVVDGGYLENSGSATALSLSRRLNGRWNALNATRRAAGQAPLPDLVVVLVQLQHDPDKLATELRRCGASARPRPLVETRPIQILDDFLGPGFSIASTQGAQTRLAIEAAAQRFCAPTVADGPMPAAAGQTDPAPPDRFFHLGLCDERDGQGAALRGLLQLSWILSPRAQVYLRDHATENCGNAAELERLRRRMQSLGVI